MGCKAEASLLSVQVLSLELRTHPKDAGTKPWRPLREVRVGVRRVQQLVILVAQLDVDTDAGFGRSKRRVGSFHGCHACRG